MKLLLPIEFAEQLRPRLPSDVEVVWADTHGNITGDPRDAEVYLNWFYLKVETLHKVLNAAPQLRWQQTPSAGVNHILTPLFLSRNIILTNGAGSFSVPIAEFVIAYILSHAKQLPQLYSLQTEHIWRRSIDLPLQEIQGATLLIIGAGSIGQAIAQRANAFEMRVWGCRRQPQPQAGFERVVGANEWRALLPDADYVVLATPLTPETKGLFDADALRSMRSTAYLINIARGEVVDEKALLTALQEGWIAGAGLDTFWKEPLPPDSPFWSLPNVVITPHCSGMTPRIVDRTIALFLDNLERYRTGQPLRNVVDQTIGY